MPLSAVILAGGFCEQELAEASGAARKSRIEIAGRTLLETAFEAAQPLGPVVIVGDSWPGAASAPGGELLTQSLAAGWAQTEGDRALFITADLPDLLPEDLAELVRLAAPETDLAYAVVPVESCARARPGIERTSLRLREGRVTGGNAFLMSRRAWPVIEPLLERVYRRRKNPLGLAALLGPSLAGLAIRSRLAPGSLSLDQAADAVGSRLGLQVQAFLLDRPGLANDLDSSEHFRLFAQACADTAQSS